MGLWLCVFLPGTLKLSTLHMGFTRQLKETQYPWVGHHPWGPQPGHGSRRMFWGVNCNCWLVCYFFHWMAWPWAPIMDVLIWGSSHSCQSEDEYGALNYPQVHHRPWAGVTMWPMHWFSVSIFQPQCCQVHSTKGDRRGSKPPLLCVPPTASTQDDAHTPSLGYKSGNI